VNSVSIEEDFCEESGRKREILQRLVWWKRYRGRRKRGDGDCVGNFLGDTGEGWEASEIEIRKKRGRPG